MIAMESAAEAGDLHALHGYAVDQTKTLRWLHLNSDVSEEKIDTFLQSRGLVKSVNDRDIQWLMHTKLREAQGLYGAI